MRCCLNGSKTTINYRFFQATNQLSKTLKDMPPPPQQSSGLPQSVPAYTNPSVQAAVNVLEAPKLGRRHKAAYTPWPLRFNKEWAQIQQKAKAYLVGKGYGEAAWAVLLVWLKYERHRAQNRMSSWIASAENIQSETAAARCQPSSKAALVEACNTLGRCPLDPSMLSALYEAIDRFLLDYDKGLVTNNPKLARAKVVNPSPRSSTSRGSGTAAARRLRHHGTTMPSPTLPLPSPPQTYQLNSPPSASMMSSSSTTPLENDAGPSPAQSIGGDQHPTSIYGASTSVSSTTSYGPSTYSKRTATETHPVVNRCVRHCCSNCQHQEMHLQVLQPATTVVDTFILTPTLASSQHTSSSIDLTLCRLPELDLDNHLLGQHS
eukprot:m.123530 g.123530  ORF g.123530 m.123530 type:complete len:377 (+) comp15680_c0_seq5:2554-3684(+)